jgi:hypothetical protein
MSLNMGTAEHTCTAARQQGGEGANGNGR